MTDVGVQTEPEGPSLDLLSVSCLMFSFLDKIRSVLQVQGQSMQSFQLYFKIIDQLKVTHYFTQDDCARHREGTLLGTACVSK